VRAIQLLEDFVPQSPIRILPHSTTGGFHPKPRVINELYHFAKFAGYKRDISNHSQ